MNSTVGKQKQQQETSRLFTENSCTLFSRTKSLLQGYIFLEVFTTLHLWNRNVSDWHKSHLGSLMQANNLFQVLGFPWAMGMWPYLFSFSPVCVSACSIVLPRIVQVCWSMNWKKKILALYLCSCQQLQCILLRHTMGVCLDIRKCKFGSAEVCVNIFLYMSYS